MLESVRKAENGGFDYDGRGLNLCVVPLLVEPGVH